MPEAGVYGFDILMEPGDDPNPNFTLQLDGSLILDTSLGVTEKFESLAQGVYRLTILLRAESAPRHWEVRWQTREAGFTPIPRSALTGPPPPNVGLLGAYYAGEQFQGQTIALRKDPILGMPLPEDSRLSANGADSYSVSIMTEKMSSLLFRDNLTKARCLIPAGSLPEIKPDGSFLYKIDAFHRGKLVASSGYVAHPPI